MELPKCEVCGESARFSVADLNEIEPGGDEAAGYFARWEVAACHWLCAEHKRAPQRKLRPVSPELLEAV